MEVENATESDINHVDHYDVSFIDDAFLSRGLTLENALDYFRMSPFYQDDANFEYEIDKTCDNSEFIKIIKSWKHPIKKNDYEGDVEQEVEYKITVLAVYYILRGTIFQCPDLYSLLKYRMYNCVTLLNQSYAELKKYVSYSASKGHKIEPTEVTKEEVKDESLVCSIVPLVGEASVIKRIKTNQLRLNSMIRDMENEFHVNVDHSSKETSLATLSVNTDNQSSH